MSQTPSGFHPRLGKFYRLVETADPKFRPILGKVLKCLEPGSPKGLGWGMARGKFEVWATEEVIEGVFRLHPLGKSMCKCGRFTFLHQWRPRCPVELN